jgi:hypothetical protein
MANHVNAKPYRGSDEPGLNTSAPPAPCEGTPGDSYDY